MPRSEQWFHTDLSDDETIFQVINGTALETGQRYFQSLVENVVTVLGPDAAWITEAFDENKSFRSLAFYFKGQWLPPQEYTTAGTPCGDVWDRMELLHIPNFLQKFYPNDDHLIGFKSYLGMPMLNLDGEFIGHFAIMDSRPMPKEPRLLALFQLFAARSAAEFQRLHAEEKVRAREEKLGRLVDSAFDAIFEIDRDLKITVANTAVDKVFQRPHEQCVGRDFFEFFAIPSRKKLREMILSLDESEEKERNAWVPGGLEALRPDGESFNAEASLSRSEVEGKSYYTVILRNVEDRLDAERRIQNLTNEGEYLREEIKNLLQVDHFIAESPPMNALLRELEEVADTPSTVLIQGETGTGKELIARMIHDASSRREKSLIKVNCAAIPANLMESEFFGHERGAFTGAHTRRVGRFELADGGTLFLDEIGDLPLELQAKLLRVLQEGEYEPLGSSYTRSVDVRIIAATNRDLEKAVEDSRFRQDLFYRLNVIPISVPPLREREDDVILMAESFAERFAQQLGRRVAPLDPSSAARLKNYRWPGNVRELENVIERAVVTARSGILNLDRALPESGDVGPSATAVESSRSSSRVYTVDQFRDLERVNISAALKSCKWRVSGKGSASRLLGMHPSTLRSRMKALDIHRAG